MASPKDKNEEEILERIAALYGQLDDIRDQRREVHTVGTEDGPRVVLVTRRLPRDRRRGQRVPDTMDQALSNFRQVTASGRGTSTGSAVPSRKCRPRRSSERYEINC